MILEVVKVDARVFINDEISWDKQREGASFLFLPPKLEYQYRPSDLHWLGIVFVFNSTDIQKHSKCRILMVMRLDKRFHAVCLFLNLCVKGY